MQTCRRCSDQIGLVQSCKAAGWPPRQCSHFRQDCFESDVPMRGGTIVSIPGKVNETSDNVYSNDMRCSQSLDNVAG